MTMLPPLFEARPSRGRLLLLFVGSLLLVAGSIFILLNPGHWPRFRFIAWPAALIGLPLFSIGAVFLVKMMLSGAAQIRIDSQGVYWKRWSKAPIPFAAIDHASVEMIGGNRFLCLHLKEPEHYQAESRFMRATAGANRKMGFGDIAIGTTGLDRSFDDLHAAYQEWARAASGWAV
jgi:hypothetical protein